MTSPEYLEVPPRRAMNGEDGTVPRKEPFGNVAKMLYMAHNANTDDVLSPTEKAMKGMPPTDQLMNGLEDTSQITRGMDDLEMVINGMDLTVGPMGRLLQLHTERGKREEERERRRRAERKRRREREKEREREEEEGGKEQKGDELGGKKPLKRKMSFMKRISFMGRSESEECNGTKRRMSFLRTSFKEKDDKEKSEAGVCKVIKRRMSFMKRTLKENKECKGFKKKMSFMRSISLKDEAQERNEAVDYKVIKGKKSPRSISLKEYTTMERSEPGECKFIKRKMSIMGGVSLKEDDNMERGEAGECKVIERKTSIKGGVSLKENDIMEKNQARECDIIKRKKSINGGVSLKENDVMERSEARECEVTKKASINGGISLKENDAMERGEAVDCKVIKKTNINGGKNLKENDAMERGEAIECKVIKRVPNINGGISLKESNAMDKDEAVDCKVIKKMNINGGISLEQNDAMEQGEAVECKVIKRMPNINGGISLKENDAPERGEAVESKGIKRMTNINGGISFKENDALERGGAVDCKVIKKKTTINGGISLKQNNAMERGETIQCKVIKRMTNINGGISLIENDAMERGEARECKVIKRKTSIMGGVNLKENDAMERSEARGCKVINDNMNIIRSASLKENNIMGGSEAGEYKAIKRKVRSMREPCIREYPVRERGRAGECRPVKRNMGVMIKSSVKEKDIMVYRDCDVGYKQTLKVRDASKDRAYRERTMYKEKGQKMFKEKEQNMYKGKEANVYKGKEAHVYRETSFNVYRQREKSAFRDIENNTYKVVRNACHGSEKKPFQEREKSSCTGKEMKVYKQKNNTFKGKEKNVCQETGMNAYKEKRFRGKCSTGEELVPMRTRNIHQMGRVNEMRRLRGRDCRFRSRVAAAPRTRIRRGRDPSYLSIWRIVLCSVVSSSTLLLPGTVSGFTAVTLPQLTNPASTDMTLTPAYASIFVSMINLGAALGGMVGMVLMVHFGQRKSLLLLLPCILVLWMVIALTTSPLLLVIARGVLGVGIAVSQSAGDTFVAETSHFKYRGRLLGISAMVLRSGSCFIYILGSTGLTWRQIAAINAILTSVPTFIGLLFLHDSPRWLMRKRRPLDAAQALQFFRGPKYDITEELLEIEDSIKESTSVREQLLRLLDISILKRLIWLSLFQLFMAYSGSFTILIYTVTIFRIANASNNAYHATIILGFVRILGGVVYLIAVDQIGRRVSIALAFLSCGISMATFSAYFYIQDVLQKTEVITSINWLPLVSLMIFVFFLGYGEPACFLLVNEILPNSFRTSGFSIIIVVHYLGGFTVSYVYPPMREEFGTHGAFAFYTLCCIALATLPYIFLPETKGRTLEDIDKYFRPRRQTQQELPGV